MEKKIDQILKNQLLLMRSMLWDPNHKPKHPLAREICKEIDNTEEILYDKEETSISDKTKFAFSKDGEE